VTIGRPRELVGKHRCDTPVSGREYHQEQRDALVGTGSGGHVVKTAETSATAATSSSTSSHCSTSTC
jgi:hypothetical protein